MKSTLKNTRYAWKRVVALTPTAELRRRLDTVASPSVRRHAACLLWWDFFGGTEDRPSVPAPEIRELMDAYRVDDASSEEDLADALTVVGYARESAVARSRLAVSFDIAHRAEIKRANRRGRPIGRTLIRPHRLRRQVSTVFDDAFRVGIKVS